MKIPNSDQAVIESTKLTDYLLNIQHKKGDSKAKLLIKCGYSLDNWQQLELDIRRFHLNSDVTVSKSTMYGVRYEILTNLITPNNEVLFVKTVWQIDIGTDIPRFITLVPA